MALGKRSTKVVSVASNAATTVLDANANRIGYRIQNIGTVDVAIAEVNTVTADTASTAGEMLKGGQTPPTQVTDVIDGGTVYGRAASGTGTVLVVQWVTL